MMRTAASEREAIVAWLNKVASSPPNCIMGDLLNVAVAIRNGEHLRDGEPKWQDWRWQEAEKRRKVFSRN